MSLTRSEPEMRKKPNTQNDKGKASAFPLLDALFWL